MHCCTVVCSSTAPRSLSATVCALSRLVLLLLLLLPLLLLSLPSPSPSASFPSPFRCARPWSSSHRHRGSDFLPRTGEHRQRRGSEGHTGPRLRLRRQRLARDGSALAARTEERRRRQRCAWTAVANSRGPRSIGRWPGMGTAGGGALAACRAVAVAPRGGAPPMSTPTRFSSCCPACHHRRHGTVVARPPPPPQGRRTATPLPSPEYTRGELVALQRRG